MPSRIPLHVLTLLVLAGALAAQVNRSSGLAQLHGPFWSTDGPTRLECLTDINGDGRLDLVIRTTAQATLPNVLKSVLSQTDGGYRQEFPSLALPAGTRRVLAGDFDGDGLADLIVETDASDPVWGAALLLCHLDGSGVATGQYVYLSPLGAPLVFAEAADLEGDGDDDLLLMLVDTTGQSLLLWVETQGSGAFAPQPALVLPAGPQRLDMIAEDLDGDGSRDAAFLVPGGIERWATMPGGFAQLPLVPHGLPSVAAPTAALAAVDLEGDGDLDFLVSEDAVTGFQVIRADPGGFVASALVASSAANPTTVTRRLLGAADLDEDGRLELVFHDRAAGASAANYGSLAFYGGADQLAPQLALSLAFDPASGFALGTWTPRRIADVDGDGLPDVVGDGGILFGAGLGRPPVQTLAQRGSLHDIDRDGDLDLVRPDLLRRNDGSGFFEDSAAGTPRLPTAPPAGATTISYVLDDGWAEADFDGDGWLDLVISADVGRAGGAVVRESRFLRGRPDGRLEDAAAAAGGQRIVGNWNEPMLVRDLDSDGDLDIAVPDVLWLNDGNNVWLPDAVTVAGWEVVEAAQFDADPGLEMIAHPNFSNAIGLYVFDAQLSGAPLLYQFSQSLTGLETIVDVDDDGDLDLVYLDYLLTQAVILRNNGQFLAPVWSSPIGVFSLNPIHVGDLDRDQVTDMIIGDRVFRNLTPGNATGFVETERMCYPVERVADIDCDGDLDFVGGIVQKSRLFRGPGAGRGRQYGLGSPGSGGYRPILGYDGPLRSGATTTAIRVSNGLGGTGGLLYAGLTPADQPAYLGTAITSYVLDTSVVQTFTMTLVGPAGYPGEGRGYLPFTILPAWAGLRVYLQASFFDPGAADFFTGTNGLELRFGN